MPAAHSNLPILWQTCLMQFRTEIARKAWVWFADTQGSGMQYAADRYALEVDYLALTLRPWLAFAAGQGGAACNDEVVDDLLCFILSRHANMRLGGNVRPPFLREAYS